MCTKLGNENNGSRCEWVSLETLHMRTTDGFMKKRNTREIWLSNDLNELLIQYCKVEIESFR